MNIVLEAHVYVQVIRTGVKVATINPTFNKPYFITRTTNLRILSIL